MDKLKITDIFSLEGRKIEVSQTILIEFLNSEGYGICRDKKHFLYGRLLQNKENIVKEIDVRHLAFEIIESMKENRIEPEYIEKFVKGSTTYLSSSNINMLQTLVINILKDEKDKAYIPYLDGLYEITKDEYKKIPYSELQTPVFHGDIIQKKFTHVTSNEIGAFEKFCMMIMGYNIHRFNTLKTVIGYLILNNKEAKEDKAIILYDNLMGNTKEANGGTGKSLLINGAIGQIRNVMSIDGKRFDKRNARFMYQNVNFNTNVIHFDDVNDDFHLDFIFPVITGDLEVEKKAVQSRTIDYYNVPKFVISSNHPIKMKTGASSNRRKLEIIFDNVFDENTSPKDYFGSVFFSPDWEESQFEKFYSFIFECVKDYLTHGLKEFKITAEQLENRLIHLLGGKETYKYFAKNTPNWIDGGRIIKRHVVDHYNSTVSEISSHAFTKKLKIYCDCNKLNLSIINSGSILFFTISKRLYE